MATFSVAGLMKEEPAILRRFIDYYRALKPERIYIYYDGALDALAGSGLDLAALDAEGVTLTACDEDFWRREHGGRPGNVHQRQHACFALAHRRNRSDWLLICDADEFLLDRMPVGEFLDRVPGDDDAVLIRPVEAVWGPDEDDIETPFASTWFRRLSKLGTLEHFMTYGLVGVLLWRGLSGHPHGKQFLRRGAHFDAIKPHTAWRGERKVGRQAAAIDPALGVMEIAHFEAICYPRWRMKMTRRQQGSELSAMASRPWRQQAVNALFRYAGWFGDGARRRLFRGLYALSAGQLRRMRRRDLAFRAALFDRKAGPTVTSH